MQVRTGGTARRTNSRNILSFGDALSFGDIERRTVHIYGVQSASVVNHDIVAHTAAVSRRHHIAVISRQNGRAGRL